MKVIVIGAQGAGMTCATKLKRNLKNSEIKVIDKASYVSFGQCGLPYFVGGFFEEPNFLFARTPESFENSGIDVILESEVIKVDTKNKLVKIKNNHTLAETEEPYDKLVIASGARTRKLPNTENIKNVIHLTSLADAKKIKDRIKNQQAKKIGILGAGYIGLELLEALREFKGLKVFVLDNKDTITGNIVDIDFDLLLKQEILDNDISLLLSQNIMSVKEENEEVVVKTYKDTYKFDLVISALGFTPNTEFLKGESLEMLSNGAIKTNNFGETNIKDVFACGDCAAVLHHITKEHKYIPLATIANKMGRIVADKVADKKVADFKCLGSSTLKVLDMEIAKTGITEYEAVNSGIPYKTFFIKDYNHTNYYPDQEHIYAKIITSADSQKILGATLMGKSGAALRIHALAMAIEQELSPEELGIMDFPYAPPFNRTWEFLNVIGNVIAKK
jgi:NADPH-dependent 2,4-dienoyl-CoA reductase/sulfur reductase-like enzyme